MRIVFNDKSYIETSLSSSPGKIFVTIGSRQEDNPMEIIVNSAEITFKEFFELGSVIPKQVEGKAL